MSTQPGVRPDPAFGLLELYDEALPHVYGYLLARCGNATLAEDLTAETFLAAVGAVRKPDAPGLSVAWHKLADHWRRVERETWTACQPHSQRQAAYRPTAPQGTVTQASHKHETNQNPPSPTQPPH